MNVFYLVRHGSTDAIGHSYTGRLAGVDLNRDGKEQAAAAAERLRDKAISAVYTSPSARARQTADQIAAVLDLQPIECAAFHEIDVGEWSGLSFGELDQSADFHLFNAARSLSRPPSGEMMIEVQTRAVTQLLRIMNEKADTSIAVVSHADVIKSALAYFLGIPLDLISRLQIDVGSISVLHLTLGYAQVVAVNGGVSEQP